MNYLEFLTNDKRRSHRRFVPLNVNVSDILKEDGIIAKVSPTELVDEGLNAQQLPTIYTSTTDPYTLAHELEHLYLYNYSDPRIRRMERKVDKAGQVVENLSNKYGSFDNLLDNKKFLAAQQVLNKDIPIYSRRTTNALNRGLTTLLDSFPASSSIAEKGAVAAQLRYLIGLDKNAAGISLNKAIRKMSPGEVAAYLGITASGSNEIVPDIYSYDYYNSMTENGNFNQNARRFKRALLKLR